MRLFLLTLLAAGAAMAQSHGYVFVSPGAAHTPGETSAMVHLGVGGEAVLPMGIGAGAEVGFIGRSSFDALGSLSLNGYYHFKRSGSWAPFVTGGYSDFFAFAGHTNLANVGGGVNYWYKDHLGIKLEFLDHFRGGSGTSFGTGSANFAEFRFGFNFK